MMNKLFKLIGGLVVTAALAACGGGGGSAGVTNPGSGTGTGTTGTDTTPSVSNVASIVLSRSGANTATPADGTTKVTLIVQALNTGSAAIAGTTLTVSVTGGGVLSAGQVVTDSNGRAAVDVSANASDQTNRNLVVSAGCSGCSASPASFTVPVRGASLELNPSAGLNLQAGGASSSITVTVRGADNSLLSGVNVSYVSSAPSIAGVSSASSFTGGNGQATVSVNGLAQGTATLSVSALGNVLTLPIDVAATSAGLSFSSPTNNSIVVIGATQAVSLNAPGASSITLATSKGLLGNGAAAQTLPVSGGVANFTIQSGDSGVASLSARDNLGRQATLSLVFSPATANKIILTAPQTSVPKASGGVEPKVVLSARALYQFNGVDQPVAGVTITFQLGAGPAGGERLEPALAVTNSSGVATTSFIAGTEATNSPIAISAEISPTVKTGLAPSSNNILMNIGGGALSVAFGPGTKVESAGNNTLYVLPYSVIVTDSSNNPVANKAVTLSMRPFAFSTGPACIVSQTFCSEDLNANGSKDDGEDGFRTPLSNDVSTLSAGMCPGGGAVVPSLVNGLLTPQNSDAGVIPSTVTTNSNGVATFNLTYLKQSGLWVVPMIKATVESNGTESSSSTIFRLKVSEEDLTPEGKCYLSDSPYR